LRGGVLVKQFLQVIPCFQVYYSIAKRVSVFAPAKVRLALVPTRNGMASSFAEGEDLVCPNLVPAFALTVWPVND